jgi:hypothetical protein
VRTIPIQGGESGGEKDAEKTVFQPIRSRASGNTGG